LKKKWKLAACEREKNEGEIFFFFSSLLFDYFIENKKKNYFTQFLILNKLNLTKKMV